MNKKNITNIHPKINMHTRKKHSIILNRYITLTLLISSIISQSSNKRPSFEIFQMLFLIQGMCLFLKCIWVSLYVFLLYMLSFRFSVSCFSGEDSLVLSFYFYLWSTRNTSLQKFVQFKNCGQILNHISPRARVILSYFFVKVFMYAAKPFLTMPIKLLPSTAVT